MDWQERLQIGQYWKAPSGWRRIRVIDAHTAGEPLRVILGGLPELPGATILQRRRYAMEHVDGLRKALMWEPRGHADMYGVILVPPVTSGADFGVLFTHNEGFSTMCGHGIIGVVKVVLETGIFPIQAPETVLKIDTPAGLVTAYARIEQDLVRTVRFHNVPSFVLLADYEIQVPGMGKIRCDIAFGGAFYAFVQARDAEVGLGLTDQRDLIEKGMAIKRTVMANTTILHPFDPDLSFLYGTIFIGDPQTERGDSRNVCIFADGEVDRSPTGTGVSARMAIHYRRGEIAPGDSLVIESILGSVFTGRVHRLTQYGPYEAVIPEVEGTAFITGINELLIDPEDPLSEGFLLR